jgi:hypothetical protein
MNIPSIRRSLLIRWGLIFVISLGLGLHLTKGLKIEQDVVASLEKSRPEEAAIFHKLKGSGFFQDQVFFRLENDKDELRAELIQKLEESGFKMSSAFEAQLKDPSELYPLLPYLPDSLLNKLLSPAHVDEIRAELRKLLNAPGGLGMVKLLALDPLLLSQEVPKLIAGDAIQNQIAPIVAKRSGDIDWEKTRSLYAWVKEHDNDLSFVAGDFFALENYDAVHHDIMLCSIFSVISSLIIFRYFCRQWSLLLFLGLGTGFSALVGLWFTQWVDGALYGLILAFASTFVSFNNETLVHLAGLDLSKGQRNGNRKPLIGVFSALGTTLIGFLVLLFSSSHLTRQLALLSLVSLLAFIAFLLLFMDSMKTVEFRPIHLPQLLWNKKVLGSTFALCLGLILILPKPSYKTNLEEFRYASAYLEKQTKIFSEKVASFSFEALHAIPLSKGSDPFLAYQKLAQDGALDTKVFHPLAYYRPKTEQDLRNREIYPRLKAQASALNKMFAEEGLALTIDPEAWSQTRSLESREYLALWEKIWPLPWYSEGQDHPFVLAFLQPGQRIEAAVPMHPRAFYEHVLSDLTANLGRLFLIGLLAMLVYLVPWQKRWDRIAMIFLPLLISTLGLQIFFHLSGRTISIVHVMGLSLVISVALDYASVLVSNEHDPKDQGKVVLTGGLTLASFGSLLLAQHPVLKELALVVFIGTAVAFVMALFTRMQRESESGL